MYPHKIYIFYETIWLNIYFSIYYFHWSHTLVETMHFQFLKSLSHKWHEFSQNNSWLL